MRMPPFSQSPRGEVGPEWCTTGSRGSSHLSRVGPPPDAAHTRFDPTLGGETACTGDSTFLSAARTRFDPTLSGERACTRESSLLLPGSQHRDQVACTADTPLRCTSAPEAACCTASASHMLTGCQHMTASTHTTQHQECTRGVPWEEPMLREGTGTAVRPADNNPALSATPLQPSTERGMEEHPSWGSWTTTQRPPDADTLRRGFVQGTEFDPSVWGSLRREVSVPQWRAGVPRGLQAEEVESRDGHSGSGSGATEANGQAVQGVCCPGWGPRGGSGVGLSCAVAYRRTQSWHPCVLPTLPLLFLLCLAAPGPVPLVSATPFLPSSFTLSSFSEVGCAAPAPSNASQGPGCTVEFPKGLLDTLKLTTNSQAASTALPSQPLDQLPLLTSNVTGSPSPDTGGGIGTMPVYPGGTGTPAVYLTVSVVPTDFEYPAKSIESIRINGQELLSQGPCYPPTGACNNTSTSTSTSTAGVPAGDPGQGAVRPRLHACFSGDVLPFLLTSWIGSGAPAADRGAVPQSVPVSVSVSVQASPGVTAPCRPCGDESAPGGGELPCVPLQASFRLVTGFMARAAHLEQASGVGTGIPVAYLQGGKIVDGVTGSLLGSHGSAAAAVSDARTGSAEGSFITAFPIEDASPQAANVVSSGPSLSLSLAKETPEKGQDPSSISVDFTATPPAVSNGSSAVFAWATILQGPGGRQTNCTTCSALCQVSYG